MTPTNHWKLGLFVVAGIVSSLCAVVIFGGRSLRKETIEYVSYFDESVQGLEVGSPVKYRGVVIGNVSEISLASDKRHVAVTYELGVNTLNAMGLTAAASQEAPGTRMLVPDGLRSELASAGITGVRFIQLDFFEAKSHPIKELPFEVPDHHIPAVPSMMTGLTQSVSSAADRIPELIDQVSALIGTAKSVLEQIDQIGIGPKVTETLLLINKLLVQVSATVDAIDVPGLSAEAKDAIANINLAVKNVNTLVSQVGGEKGLANSLKRTSDSLGAMAENANQVGPTMEETMRDVQSAARSVQRLADALDRDPDMLLKGKAHSQRAAK